MKRTKLTKLLITGLRNIDGIKRWEIASQKMKFAREFHALGMLQNGTKRTA